MRALKAVTKDCVKEGTNTGPGQSTLMGHFQQMGCHSIPGWLKPQAYPLGQEGTEISVHTFGLAEQDTKALSGREGARKHTQSPLLRPGAADG